MTDQPYRKQPARAFWSRAVAKNFSAADVVSLASPGPLMTLDDRVMSAGSCFASNLVPYLERAGITYLRTERPHPAFARLPENLGYRNFTAAYGNVYTVRQLRQLLERSLGLFHPVEDRWHIDGHVIDPFRPGLRYPARSDAEFDRLTQQHLAAVRLAFRRATVLVFTLGLTEAWVSCADGAVFPACPGTVAGTYDPEKHRFHNFTATEIRDDLVALLKCLRGINPAIRVILTVSPVPLVATATNEHVLSATVYSKSVLRVAAGEVATSEPGVTYFPAYEIVTGPQAPHEYFEEDRRSVSAVGVQAVMDVLIKHCAITGSASERPRKSPWLMASMDGQRPTESATEPERPSQQLAEVECEEVMADEAG
jgi:hypothetical protein